jgi:hypothetical protein
LLDWLAADFIEHGWDHKRLHRMIVLSDTYRQSSRRRPDLEGADPENLLLGRANLRRLEAEAIRDALLSVTGKLEPALGGEAIPVIEDSEGKAVIGGDGQRRSAFVQVQRRLPLNMLATFDQPEMTPNCDQRHNTTVATQALWFLNDGEIVAHSDSLANSLIAASPETGGRLGELFLRLFAAPPSPDELQTCAEFLREQGEHFAAADPGCDPAQRALASLCQVLLGSNRFLYID